MIRCVLLVDRVFRSALLCCALAFSVTGAPPVVEFVDAPATGEITSSDGSITLSWTVPPEPWLVELQQGTSMTFVTNLDRYWGRDAGSVITGLAEGTHYFRVRAVDDTGTKSAWSEPLSVEVTFMNRSRLFWLLSLGGLVVGMTVVTILAGYISHRSKQSIGNESR